MIRRRSLRSTGIGAAFVVTMLVSSIGCGTTEFQQAPPIETPLPHRLRSDAAAVLVSGEVARYVVTWHFLTMGTITFAIEDDPSDGDRRLLRSTTAPSAIAAALTRFGGIAESRFDVRRGLPTSYSWTSPRRADRRRRFNLFREDSVFGLDLSADEWEYELMMDPASQDPVSIIFLTRVVELEPEETLRVLVDEGTKSRLATVRHRGFGKTPTRARHPDVDAEIIELRMDKRTDGHISDREPEVDQRLWIAASPDRALLRAEGRVRGHPLIIDLVERSSPRSSEGGANSTAASPSEQGPGR